MRSGATRRVPHMPRMPACARQAADSSAALRSEGAGERMRTHRAHLTRGQARPWVRLKRVVCAARAAGQQLAHAPPRLCEGRAGVEAACVAHSHATGRWVGRWDCSVWHLEGRRVGGRVGGGASQCAVAGGASGERAVWHLQGRQVGG